VSEVDVTGQVLSTFTNVRRPSHLSTDSEDHVFVADYYNARILLLNSKLQLERVLIDINSQVELRSPYRLHYNELTSQLHVVHAGYFISQLSLRWVTNSWLVYTHSPCLSATFLTRITHVKLWRIWNTFSCKWPVLCWWYSFNCHHFKSIQEETLLILLCI